MSTWIAFASWTADDSALWNSHWIASQTIRLAAHPPRLIEREHAVREDLELALKDQGIEGLALFGHGRPHAMLGVDGRPALDRDNLGCVRTEWVHAIACLTGCELVPAAVGHAALFVGYRVPLIVEWSVEELPDELRERLAYLVTATTLALLAGVRRKADLQRRAAQAADEVTFWLLENTAEGYLGIHILAEQLVDRMVVNR